MQNAMATEQQFVKEEIAKVTVETAKQMCPQHWKDFLKDLNDVCNVGVSSHQYRTFCAIVVLSADKTSDDLNSLP